MAAASRAAAVWVQIAACPHLVGPPLRRRCRAGQLARHIPPMPGSLRYSSIRATMERSSTATSKALGDQQLWTGSCLPLTIQRHSLHFDLDGQPLCYGRDATSARRPCRLSILLLIMHMLPTVGRCTQPGPAVDGALIRPDSADAGCPSGIAGTRASPSRGGGGRIAG